MKNIFGLIIATNTLLKSGIILPKFHHLSTLHFHLTIANIFNDFFREKEKVVTYICDTADGKELARFRKFNIWFTKFNTNFFLKIDKSFYDSKQHITYYNSLIIRQDNPYKDEIIEAFDDLIGGFEEDK